MIRRIPKKKRVLQRNGTIYIYKAPNRKNISTVSFPYFTQILILFIISLFFLPKIFSSQHNHTQEAQASEVATINPFSFLTPTITPAFPLNPTPTTLPTPTMTPTTVLTEADTTHSNQAPLQNDYCLNVPILLYHHTEPLNIASALGHAQLTVDASIFDTQMAYLQTSGYHTVSVDDIVQAIKNHEQLPPKSIAVTLDDGYIDAYQYAFPVEKKYGLQMNYMIPTGLVGNNDYLTWNNLKEMSKNPFTHIYNHTWSHAPLGQIADDKVQYEVSTAQKELQDNLGVNTNTFVYPYGSFSPQAISILKKNGYVAGLSTIGGRIQCESYIMTLHRDHVGNVPLSFYGL